MAVETGADVAQRVPEVRRYRFTVADFYRLDALGFFKPDARIELVDGELMHMAPIGPHHHGTVMGLDERLRDLLGRRVSLSVQGPLDLPPFGTPQPDLLVLRRRDDHYRSANPTAEDVLLLIEVSDTTLEYDRAVKGPIYAAAGIADYWIVNLAGRQVLVLREPRDGQYTSVQALVSGDAARPLAFGEIALEVAAILA